MRSDDDMKNYWREYSKFGQHEQVTKNSTLNQNNQNNYNQNIFNRPTVF